MGKMDTYNIDLLSQQLKGESFEMHLDDDVFASIEGLIQKGSIDSTVKCLSVGTMFRFQIHSEGTVIVPCDRCLSDLELRIDTTDELMVKLGDEYSDEGDCVIVPESEGMINMAQYIYEYIALSMPITCSHEPGKCDDAMMAELVKHQAARSGQEDEESNDSTEIGDDADNNSPFAALKGLKFDD